MVFWHLPSQLVSISPVTPSTSGAGRPESRAMPRTSGTADTTSPVPFLIYDSREKTCSGLSYTEKNGLKTGLFLPEGTALLDMLFEK